LCSPMKSGPLNKTYFSTCSGVANHKKMINSNKLGTLQNNFDFFTALNKPKTWPLRVISNA